MKKLVLWQALRPAASGRALPARRSVSSIAACIRIKRLRVGASNVLGVIKRSEDVLTTCGSWSPLEARVRLNQEEVDVDIGIRQRTIVSCVAG